MSTGTDGAQSSARGASAELRWVKAVRLLDEAHTMLSVDAAHGVEIRDSIRRLNEALRDWQAVADPVGFVGQIASSEGLLEVLDEVSTYPDTERATKVASAVLARQYDVLTRPVVERAIAVFDSRGVVPTPWHLRQACVGLLLGAAGDGPETIAEKETSSRLDNFALVDSYIERLPADGTSGSPRRDAVAQLVTTALADSDPRVISRLLAVVGGSLTPAVLNRLLRSLAAGGGQGRESVVHAVTVSLATRPLNSRIGRSILGGIRESGELGQLSDAIRALVVHPSDDVTERGCLGPDDLLDCLKHLHSSDSAATIELVRDLAATSPVELNDRHLAVVVAAACRLPVSTDDSVAAVVRDSYGAPFGGVGVSIRCLTELSGDLPADGLATVVATLLASPGSKLPWAPNWTQPHGLALIRAAARRAKRESQWPALRRMIDATVAVAVAAAEPSMVHGIDATLVEELLNLLPAEDVDAIAIRRLRSDPAMSPTPDIHGRAALDRIAAARAEVRLEAGELHEAFDVLAGVAPTKLSLAVRSRVLRAVGRQADGVELVALLRRVALIGDSQTCLDGRLTGPQRELAKVAASIAIERRSYSVLARLTGFFGAKPPPRRLSITEDGQPEVDTTTLAMPVWLLESWGQLLDTQRQKAAATTLVDAAYQLQLDAWKTQRRGTADAVRASRKRLTSLALLLAERRARGGGGYLHIRRIIAGIERLSGPTAPKVSAALLEQLLVATKKAARRSTFEREVGPRLERLGLRPTAGIWTTLVLGAFITGADRADPAAGEACLADALRSLHQRPPAAAADKFFSVNETRMIAGAFPRDREAFRNLDGELGAVHGPDEAFVALLRSVSRGHAAEGDTDGVDRVRGLLTLVTPVFPGPVTLLEHAKAGLATDFVVACATATERDGLGQHKERIVVALSGDAGTLQTPEAADAVADLLVAAELQGAERPDLAEILEASLATTVEPIHYRLFVRTCVLAIERIGLESNLVALVLDASHRSAVSLPDFLSRALAAHTVAEARTLVRHRFGSEGDPPAVTVRQFEALCRLIGHELQLPQTNMAGLQDLLSADLRSADADTTTDVRIRVEDVRDYITFLRAGSSRLAEVLDAITPVKSTTRGADVAALLRAVVRRMEPELLAQRCRILVAEPDRPIHVDIPSVALRLIVSNLVTNALKSITDGSTGNTIHVSATIHAAAPEDSVAAPYGWAEISVSDTGTGVPDVIVASLNEGRWVADPTFGGVGLSVTELNVRIYGGSLVFHRNAGGVGTSAVVVLPVAPPPSSP